MTMSVTATKRQMQRPQRLLFATLISVFAQWPVTASAFEPLLSCRVSTNTIASNLRIGGGNQFVVLRDDKPVIAYYNLPQSEPAPLLTTNFPPDAGLYLHTCNDEECSSGTTVLIEGSTAPRSVDLSMVLQGAEQKAVIASYNKDTASPGIRQYYCNDLTCTQSTILRRTTGTALTPNLTLSPGERPFLVFGSPLPDNSQQPLDLFTCRCAGPACNPLPSCTQFTDPVNNGRYPATLWRGATQPALVAHSGEITAVLQCSNMDCTSGVSHPVTGVPVGHSTAYTNIAAHPGSLPLIGFAAFRNLGEGLGLPMLAACADDNCTAASARPLDTVERQLRLVRLTMRPNGRGLVTWGEEPSPAGSALRFYQCADPPCSHGRTGTVVANPEVGHAVALRSDGVAVVAFRPDNAGTLKLAFCGLPDDLIFYDDFDPR